MTELRTVAQGVLVYDCVNGGKSYYAIYRGLYIGSYESEQAATEARMKRKIERILEKRK